MSAASCRYPALQASRFARFVRASIAVASFSFLTACVASTTPPGELLSALVPPAEETTNGDTNIVEAVADANPAAEATQGDAGTETALTADATSTKAQQAAESVGVPRARPETTVAQNTPTAPTPASDASSTAETVAVAAAAPTPPPAKNSTSLLSRIFQANEASKPPVTRSKTTGRVIKRPTATVNANTQRMEALPGVRTKGLFGIFGSENQRPESLDDPIEVASVSNLARRGNFGLLLQRPDVKVGCFPQSLVRILKKVERRFGRTPIVTSGYRSRAKNRRIRGARNSTHINCTAADIQVKGVSKWQVAKYLRSIPNRGGVGTYCHTNSVHIDVGKKRDWNWRCRRKKRTRT